MRSLVGKRKTATPAPRHPGGQFQGVQTTDPAGRTTTTPFTGNSGDVLRGDGTFGSAGGSFGLTYDAALGAFVVPI